MTAPCGRRAPAQGGALTLQQEIFPKTDVLGKPPGIVFFSAFYYYFSSNKKQ
jgi:hypothetical protein